MVGGPLSRAEAESGGRWVEPGSLPRGILHSGLRQMLVLMAQLHFLLLPPAAPCLPWRKALLSNSQFGTLRGH